MCAAESALVAAGTARVSAAFRTTVSANRLRARPDAITLEASGAAPVDDLLQFGDVEELLSMMESSQERQMIDLSLQAERYRGREATMVARPEDITMRQVGLGMAELDLFDLDLLSEQPTAHVHSHTHLLRVQQSSCPEPHSHAMLHRHSQSRSHLFVSCIALLASLRGGFGRERDLVGDTSMQLLEGMDCL